MLLHECWYKTKSYSPINWAHIVFWVYLDHSINLYVITLMKTLKWSYSSDFSAALPRTKKLLIFGFSNAKKKNEWINSRQVRGRSNTLLHHFWHSQTPPPRLTLFRQYCTMVCWRSHIYVYPPPLLPSPSKALSCILMAPSSLPLTSGDLSNLPQVAMRRYKDIMKY
jgi:hypothetical protein